MIHIILGLFIVFTGLMLVLKTEWLLENFGRIDFFENHLGTEGGSRLGYKLIGILVIFVGILIFTNLMNSFLGWLLSPLINHIIPVDTP